jgi:glycosyltransferase involved in cell wall biosynthesis
MISLSKSEFGLDFDLLIRCHTGSALGFGHIAEWYGRVLESLGYRVGFSAISRHEWASEPRFVVDRLVEQSDYLSSKIPLIQFSDPITSYYDEDVNGYVPSKIVICTTWESSELPALAVANLNLASLVIVPNRWNAENFRRDGVSTPIHVVPYGYSPKEWLSPKMAAQGEKRRGEGEGEGKDRVFRVGMAGRTKHGASRKGITEGIMAFWDAFRFTRDVELHIKTHRDCLMDFGYPKDDRRFVVDSELVSSYRMSLWYRNLDVYLCPSKCEGWGLHTLQAMACGVPVIAAKFGGTAEFFDSTCGWEIEYDLEPAGDHYVGLGEWAVPRHKSMMGALREAYEDRDKVKVLGSAAAERAGSFTWDMAGETMRDVLVNEGILKALPRDSSVALPRVLPNPMLTNVPVPVPVPVVSRSGTTA